MTQTRHIVDGRYLAAFNRKLSALLIKANWATIMELGQLIHEAQEGQYWRSWSKLQGQKNYPTFSEWCIAVLHCRERKAQCLAKLFADLTAMNLSEPTLYRAIKLGWTKLYQVLKVARSETTLIQWLDHVESNALTEQQIRTEIKVAAGDRELETRAGHVEVTGDPTAPPQGGSSGVSSVKDLPVPTSYSPPDKPPVKHIRKTVVYKDDESVRIFEQGCRAVRARTNSEIGDGEAGALMATHYLATCPATDDGGIVTELEYVCRAIEHTYKVPVVVAGDTGLVGRCLELLKAWGCESHDDPRVLALIKDMQAALSASKKAPEIEA